MKVVEILQNKSNFYIVSEILDGGQLDERLNEVKFIKEDDVRSIVNQILLAINYLHKTLNIVHRDLKPQNILLDSLDDFKIKVVDFGFSVYNQNLRNCCGSPKYMSPE